VLETLERDGHLIYPSVASLKVIQNKYTQNQTLEKHGVPLPRFALVDSVDAIRHWGDDSRFGYPLMLKATMGGYDGKGNALIRDESEVESAFASLGGGQIELMVEEFVPFQLEISILATRAIDGSCVIYPVAENMHRNSILDTTIVPARVSQEVVDRATEIAHRVMEVFAGVGTFCIEMFVTEDGAVSVNEVAPRPHNSGHYTIEGCLANQFENHIRAIVGLPLGSVALHSPTVMVNLLGESDGLTELLGLHEAYEDPQVKVHLYGKETSQRARKMGHFTVLDKTVDGALARAARAKELLHVVGR